MPFQRVKGDKVIERAGTTPPTPEQAQKMKQKEIALQNQSIPSRVPASDTDAKKPAAG